MNVLDENIIASQRAQLRKWRVAFRQIGFELSRSGAEDTQIIPLLLRLNQPTFFTRDFDFFRSKFCHVHYSVVWLNVRPDEAVEFIRRFLKHPQFDTQTKRLGMVARVNASGVQFWRKGKRGLQRVGWEA